LESKTKGGLAQKGEGGKAHPVRGKGEKRFTNASGAGKSEGGVCTQGNELTGPTNQEGSTQPMGGK